MSNTPRTDAIMALVRQLACAPIIEHYYALREGVQCAIEQLEIDLATAKARLVEIEKAAELLVGLSPRELQSLSDAGNTFAVSEIEQLRDHAMHLAAENMRLRDDARKQIDQAFMALDVFGVSRKQAKSVANGICILAQRFKKETQKQKEIAAAYFQGPTEPPPQPLPPDTNKGD